MTAHDGECRGSGHLEGLSGGCALQACGIPFLAPLHCEGLPLQCDGLARRCPAFWPEADARAGSPQGCGDFVDCLEAVLHVCGSGRPARRTVLTLLRVLLAGRGRSNGQLVSENLDPSRELLSCCPFRQVVEVRLRSGRADREHGQPLRSHLGSGDVLQQQVVGGLVDRAFIEEVLDQKH